MRGLSIGLQFYEHSNMPSLAKLTEEQLKLLDAQRGLEKSTRGMPDPPGAPPSIAARFKFIDLPLNETIVKCFAYNQSSAAERLKTECKIPERRWWSLKLKGLMQARDWVGLWELSSSARRSPIGYKPFVEACVKQGAYDEACRYIAKLTPAEAVPMYLQINKVDDARRVAVQHKDKQPDLLEAVLKHAEGR